MVSFSIITVCFNAGQDLPETVRRTLNQTYPNFEILVKDGGSRDGSLDLLPEDPRIRVICKPDAGIYDAMNQAVAEAQGEYLIFMNCGDWFYGSETLGKIAEGIGEEKAPLYYGKCYDRMTGQVRAYPKQLTRMTCYRTMICHQATVYRADVLKERNYDLSYPILADREMLWYLVCEKKVQPVYLDTVIADYQGGGESAKEAHVQRNREDQQRLLGTYFSKGEQLKYKLLMALTFQKLRVSLSKSPKFSKYYFKAIQALYDCKEKLTHRRGR
ncbi:MAG: glycosyltransferase family 2 protein [Candidatus Faecousia sp.]|nr:glycosyltransferase family 2 protein [Candidatus Faecousia sp.]